LAHGFFGLNIKDRTACLYDDGATPLSTSAFPQVGHAVAKLFELPVATLDDYKNRFVYVHSFHVAHNEMLDSLYKATGSSESD